MNERCTVIQFLKFLNGGYFSEIHILLTVNIRTSLKVIPIDSCENPSNMMLALKSSMTNPFGAGFILHLGRMATDLFHACILGFLYRFSDGSPLTRECLSMELRKGLQSCWHGHGRF